MSGMRFVYGVSRQIAAWRLVSNPTHSKFARFWQHRNYQLHLMSLTGKPLIKDLRLKMHIFEWTQDLTWHDSDLCDLLLKFINLINHLSPLCTKLYFLSFYFYLIKYIIVFILLDSNLTESAKTSRYESKETRGTLAFCCWSASHCTSFICLIHSLENKTGTQHISSLRPVIFWKCHQFEHQSLH